MLFYTIDFEKSYIFTQVQVQRPEECPEAAICERGHHQPTRVSEVLIAIHKCRIYHTGCYLPRFVLLLFLSFKKMYFISSILLSIRVIPT